MLFPLNRRAWLWCIIPLFAAVISCRDGDWKESNKSKASRGVRYVKALPAFPATFDPSRMNDLYALTVGNLIYAGLLEYNDDLEVQGDLAETFKTSRDGKTLSFTLRKGLQFHDGTPISAENVVGSFKRLLAPSSLVYGYYDCIEGAKAYHEGRANTVPGLISASAQNVVIRLEHPFPPFLSILAGGTAKVLPVGPDFKADKFFQRPIGAGPFMLSQIGTKRLELMRYENYHGPHPHFKELFFDFSPLPQLLKNAEAGEIHDMVSYPLVGTEAVFAAGQHIRAPLAETWIIGINARLPPFDDLSVRRAFQASIPTQSFRQKLHPVSARAFGYIPPGLPGHLTESDLPALAKIAHQKAKISKRSIKVAFPAGLYQGDKMRAFLENALNAKGWNVKIEEMPWDKLLKGYTAKTWQAFLVTMNMDYPDPEFLFKNFESASVDNFSGLKDPLIDRMLQQARDNRDRLKREAIYRALSFRVAELVPVVPLLHPRAHYWLHPCVRGFKPNSLSHIYTDYRQIYLDEKCLSSKGWKMARHE